MGEISWWERFGALEEAEPIWRQHGCTGYPATASVPRHIFRRIKFALAAKGAKVVQGNCFWGLTLRQIVRCTILAASLASLAGCASFPPFGRNATPAAQQAGAQVGASQAAPQSLTQTPPQPAAQAPAQSPAQAPPQQSTPAPSQPAAQTALPPPPQSALPPPPQTSSQAAPQTSPSATAQTGNIEIVNRTQNAIDVVALGECDSSGEGSNVLPSGQTIAPGASRSFPAAAGCWDVGVGVTNVGEARQRLTVEAAATVQYVIN